MAMAPDRLDRDRRLGARMVAVVVLFGLVPLVAMGVAGYLASRRALTEQTRSALAAMVANRKVTVELFLDETMRQLELAAEAIPVAELARPSVLDGLLQQMGRRRGGIVDLGLIGSDGRHLAYVGPYHLQEFDYHEQSWFREVMVLGRYESDVFLGFRRFPHMVMAVKRRDAGRDYVLRATVDTDLLGTLAREGGLESGAEVFILNRGGEYQTGDGTGSGLMERAAVGPQPLHAGVRVVETRGPRGRELIATSWLRGEAWVLVARQRLPGQFQAPGFAAVLAVFLAGALLVPLLAVVVVRRRLRQMRDLQAERASLYETVAQSQKMAAVGRLAAGVAHEINNPLAIIQAQAGVLRDLIDDRPGMPEAPELSARVQRVEQQIERIRKVTHRLLGFSRRLGPEVEPVDVVAALDETVGFVEAELQGGAVALVKDYQDVPIVRTSLGQVQQVFLNLINNALDALGGRGEIRLAVRAADPGVVVEVSDNGPGIPAADVERIFDPFYSTKSGDRHHAGLGLAICRDIMLSLGGRITVLNRPGGGTTFSLWFPTDGGGR